MSKAKIFGVRPYDFIDEKTKERKYGASAWIGELGENIVGLECNKISLRGEVYTTMLKQVGEPAKLLNREIEVMYNRAGKVEGATLISG